MLRGGLKQAHLDGDEQDVETRLTDLDQQLSQVHQHIFHREPTDKELVSDVDCSWP